MEVARRTADLLTLELEVAVDLHVGHRDRQHLLVYVASGDSIRHRPLVGERRACFTHRISQGRRLSSVA